MTAQLRNGAVISADEKYRYRLWRTHAHGAPDERRILFVMLNPSTADGLDDDPTIRKCRGFAKRFGCAGFDVVNLFAFRATDAKRLRDAQDPVGPLNDGELDKALRRETYWHRIAAWGGATKAKRIMEERRDWFVRTYALEIERGELMCLGETKDGNPRHPLMLSYDTPLVSWRPR